MNSLLSHCCGASLSGYFSVEAGWGICSNCGEHAEFKTDEEWAELEDQEVGRVLTTVEVEQYGKYVDAQVTRWIREKRWSWLNEHYANHRLYLAYQLEQLDESCQVANMNTISERRTS